MKLSPQYRCTDARTTRAREHAGMAKNRNGGRAPEGTVSS
jgi:hypothetical protein